MNTNLTNLALQGVGIALNFLVAAVGVRASQQILTQLMENMVKQQRGPTNEELDVLIGGLEARSQRIQNS